MGEFKDVAHLIRLAGVFLLGLILFLVFRSVTIPKSFGRYGPFRGAALVELSARPLAFAGHEACENCHPDVAELKAKGVHKSINCESCHGPLAKHADDPGNVKPVLPEVAQLCIRCHSENTAKPAGFPQVNAKEHSGGQACNTCHKPHSPGFDAGGKK
ncbi:MAG: multiheme c-type cytochrome [Candidatus Acidiferrum sp.]|jgi:uncharacterized CHY-type Zn-finger protein